jgi:hypothetical protein
LSDHASLALGDNEEVGLPIAAPQNGAPAMPPISLSDDQLTTSTRAAEPLLPFDRGPFLERVAEMLRGVEVGDGAVARAVRTAQGELFRPPQVTDGTATSRWSRSCRSSSRSAPI